VFEAMLANAVRICGAKFGVLWLKEAMDTAPSRCTICRLRSPNCGSVSPLLA